MDWDLAIKRNSEGLRGIVEILFALLGLDGTDAASRIPRSLHSAVLQMLRPAESALRRLIVIAVRSVVVKLAPLRPMPAGKVIGKGGGNSLPSFQLFDPRKRVKGPRARAFNRIIPRIHFFGPDPRWRPCFQHPGLWPNPRHLPMASSTSRALPAGSRRLSWRSMTFHARPNVSPAGGRGGRHRQV
jgi:hypothetical protein